MSAALTEQAAMLAIDGACRVLRLPTVRAQARRARRRRRPGPAHPPGLPRRGARAPRSTSATAGDASGASPRPGSRGSSGSRSSTSPRRRRSRRRPSRRSPRSPGSTAGEPVVLLGDPGTGKTHLLIGLGIAACEEGLRVRYVTAAALVNELAEAADERVLARTVARYARLDLLCLDELGYVHLDPRGAELLFQVITERDERASIAVASQPAVLRVGLGRSPTGASRPRSSTA